jgi:hypothetical protein
MPTSSCVFTIAWFGRINQNKHAKKKNFKSFLYLSSCPYLFQLKFPSEKTCVTSVFEESELGSFESLTNRKTVFFYQMRGCVKIMSNMVLTSKGYVDNRYKFIKKSTIFQCLLLLVSLRALENALRGTLFNLYLMYRNDALRGAL